MGQREIIDWLVEQRHNGNEQFFTTDEIKAAMLLQGHSIRTVYASLRGLDCFLEMEIVNLHQAKWRVKKQYVGVADVINK